MPRACMAASFTILTGPPNAVWKANPTHPPPRLCGSHKGRPWITGPGYPMETTEYSQPAAAFRTSLTIFLAVIFDPDGILTGSLPPVSSTFTFVPPTSITNTIWPCLSIRLRAGHKDITGPQTSHGAICPSEMQTQPARFSQALPIYAKVTIDWKRRCASTIVSQEREIHVRRRQKTDDAAGRPVGDNQNSLTVGPRGPIVFEDYQLFEKMAQFNRERIPERVVHAKGSGAHGYFACTNPDMAKYTTAKLFSAAGKRTPTFIRFSTVGGEKGSADTERDPRGFALKFYTEEG